MPIDFPNSPSLNQEFTANDRTWRWTGTAWDSVAQAAPSTIISDTEPDSPIEGTRWLKSTTWQEFVYYSNEWIELI
jgi:hypothetical protein